MKIKQELKNVETEWYTKPSDTGVLLNFRARYPGRYKRNIVEGLVHRIFSATSSWEAFTKGLDEAMLILERNQYPPVFFNQSYVRHWKRSWVRLKESVREKARN